MKSFALEIGGLDTLLYMILAIMFGPPVLLVCIGIGVRKNKKFSKVLFILAATYLLIGLGICASMIYG